LDGISRARTIRDIRFVDAAHAKIQSLMNVWICGITTKKFSALSKDCADDVVREYEEIPP